MSKTRLSLINIVFSVLSGVCCYSGAVSYMRDGVISWSSIFLLSLLVREIVKTNLSVGNFSIDKTSDAMTFGEKLYARSIKALVLIIWGGYVLLLIYKDGTYMNSKYVLIFISLTLLTLVLDITIYVIRKKNNRFLRNEGHGA